MVKAMANKSRELATFEQSVSDHASYPKSLVRPDIYSHALDRYFEFLDADAKRLLCAESDAQVVLHELYAQCQKFDTTVAHNLNELKVKFENVVSGLEDPLCRFMFVSAPNSRDRLFISRPMLTYAFTYLQVMAGFLDFLFPFGERENAEDFHFSGFRYSSRLTPLDRGHAVPELSRSGLSMEMCFNLKSVEVDGSLQSGTWSFRQTAVYHSFDIESGKSNWIIVKGNDLIEQRLTPETDDQRYLAPSEFRSVGKAFTASMESHLILCNWANENWRWYIKGLEDRCQELSEGALASRIPRCTDVPWETMDLDDIGKVKPLKAIVTDPWMKVQRTLSIKPSKNSCKSGDSVKMGRPGKPKVVRREFAFETIQRMHFVEEQTKKSILGLRANVDSMKALKLNYFETMNSNHFTTTTKLKDECWPKFERFQRRVDNIISEQEAVRSRTEALLQLITDRKNLLHAILEYRNMEASLVLAGKSQKLTTEMHRVAKKTEEETVSMKIITVVTLFFLPGTFISVGQAISGFIAHADLQTLMSTDIIRFQENSSGGEDRLFSSAALKLYLEISLPLMLATFVAWFGVYLYATRQENLRAIKRRMARMTDKV